MSRKVYLLREDDLRGEVYRRVYLLMSKNRWTWQSLGATFGISGGMLSLLTALLLWATVRFLTAGGSVSALHTCEIVFFALPLPLLALGVHCLDLLEKKLPTLPLPANAPPADFKRWLRLRPRHLHHN
ncbi:MAG: hypothetical protein QOG71_2861 [Pyrinomonadaceae bacterium]|nr:hypothetical protein [Pyrinomonadaceae bacterium]